MKTGYGRSMKTGITSCDSCEGVWLSVRSYKPIRDLGRVRYACWNGSGNGAITALCIWILTAGVRFFRTVVRPQMSQDHGHRGEAWNTNTPQDDVSVLSGQISGKLYLTYTRSCRRRRSGCDVSLKTVRNSNQGQPCGRRTYHNYPAVDRRESG